jgi:hypothetical protein
MPLTVTTSLITRVAYLGSVLIGMALLASPSASAIGRVTSTGTMSAERAAHQATRLLDGGVLITGGCGGQSCDTVHRSTELYDAKTTAFRTHAQMTVPRASHAAALLADGRVLLVGGWTGSAPTASAELFDPASRKFIAAGEMSAPRINPAATVLRDGRVLITGGVIRTGSPLKTAEIYDPRTGSFAVVGDMADARMHHTATLLSSGRVLITGGHRARGDVLRSAEIFDPTTNRFVRAGDLIAPRHKHAAVQLADGRVLIVGGSDARDFQGRYASTEVYDGATARFSRGPALSSVRHKIPDSVIALPSGEVLVLGGAKRPEILRRGQEAFVELQGELPAELMFATATLLSSGSVLLLGGYDERIQVYDGAWIARVQ